MDRSLYLIVIPNQYLHSYPSLLQTLCRTDTSRIRKISVSLLSSSEDGVVGHFRGNNHLLKICKSIRVIKLMLLPHSVKFLNVLLTDFFKS